MKHGMIGGSAPCLLPNKLQSLQIRPLGELISGSCVRISCQVKNHEGSLVVLPSVSPAPIRVLGTSFKESCVRKLSPVKSYAWYR